MMEKSLSTLNGKIIEVRQLRDLIFITPACKKTILNL